jgi:hypothetical protein
LAGLKAFRLRTCPISLTSIGFKTLQNYNKVVISQTFAVNICENEGYSWGMQSSIMDIFFVGLLGE